MQSTKAPKALTMLSLTRWCSSLANQAWHVFTPSEMTTVNRSDADRMIGRSAPPLFLNSTICIKHPPSAGVSCTRVQTPEI